MRWKNFITAILVGGVVTYVIKSAIMDMTDLALTDQLTIYGVVEFVIGWITADVSGDSKD